MPDMTTPRPRWAIVVPVKHLAAAKSRLLASGAVRRELALAMALDTVRAAAACPAVTVVVAVSDDRQAVDALQAAGVLVVPDRPDAGLNPALAHGAQEAAARHPGVGIAAMSADLPALRPGDLDAVLVLAAGTESAVVGDAGGEGTTLLTARSAEFFRPRFGEQSRRAHVAAGAVDLTASTTAPLRQDVDTVADLAVAAALGCGPATSAVLARHPELLRAVYPHETAVDGQHLQ
jgi:2-phospho-L-lactate/phosphoenolpyruvate guanylyltransferase